MGVLRGQYAPARFVLPTQSLAGMRYRLRGLGGGLGQLPGQQGFPWPQDVGQLWVHPQTCVEYVYDNQEVRWVPTGQTGAESAAVAVCLAQRTGQTPPAGPSGPPWWDQELIQGVPNSWLVGGSAGLLLLLVLLGKRRR